MDKEQITVKINVDTSDIEVMNEKVRLALLQANTLNMLLEEVNILSKEFALSKSNTKKAPVFQVVTLVISVIALVLSLFAK